ncbi:hypothetical protein Z043_107106 [Scleropages formosus]|uniref:Uncharacterized protein n=1 Tax=Scleropages formosus TaxID=113540 RepID=A0A0N8K129_SCLFO|nr:hypothetical protein Z043_107106 [Scleropages formosus]
MLLLYNRLVSLLESIYRRGARRWRKLYRVNGHLFQAKRFNRDSFQRDLCRNGSHWSACCPGGGSAVGVSSKKGAGSRVHGGPPPPRSGDIAPHAHSRWVGSASDSVQPTTR